MSEPQPNNSDGHKHCHDKHFINNVNNEDKEGVFSSSRCDNGILGGISKCLQGCSTTNESGEKHHLERYETCLKKSDASTGKTRKTGTSEFD